MKFSKFITILILPILFFFSVLAQNNPRLDTPDNIKEFRTVISFTLTMTVLGSCGCFYVFYRTYKQLRLNKNGRKLKMIYRLPFYTACSDFLINVNYFINIIHTAIYAKVWDQPVCNIISTSHWLFLVVNLSLYSVIALTTYLRIRHEIYFHRGKWDYKLWLIVVIFSVIFQLINLRNQGQRKYWCNGKQGQVISTTLVFSVISISLITICYCYIMTLYTTLSTRDPLKEIGMNYINNNSTDSQNSQTEEIEDINRSRRMNIERRAAKKIISYVLVFILQWTPVQINIISRWTQARGAWTYILAACVMFGGIGNALNYILNEGWHPRKSDHEITEITSDTNYLNDENELNKINNTINNDFFLTLFNKMVFHSHHIVTDKKTGIVHNLCCYKECSANAKVVGNYEKESGINVNNNNNNNNNNSNNHNNYGTMKDFLKSEPLFPSSKDETITHDDYPETFIRPKKHPQKKGPIFKLKISSDIVDGDYKNKRQGHKAYKSAMMNIDYSSDELVEVDTGTESRIDNSGAKKICAVVDCSEDEECVEIDATEFPKPSSSRNLNVHNDYNDCIAVPSTSSNSGIVDSPIEPFHKAVEDARNAMITLIDKFHFEQPSSPSPDIQSLFQGSTPVITSKPNIVNTYKTFFKNEKNERKKIRVKSQFGTSKFPIDLDKDDNVGLQIKQTVLNDDSKSGRSSIQGRDDLMINWFDRDDFKKFMLNSAKRRLEELDIDSHRSRKYFKVDGKPSQSSFRNHRNSSHEVVHLNSRNGPPIVKIPDFKNQKYLTLALTHSSVHFGQQNGSDERLEMFGDCILSTTISQMAYEKFRDQLTPDLFEQIHKDLLSNHRLCQFAKMLRLQDLIYTRKPFLSVKEIANIFIALLAAIVMDSGREVAVDFIRKLIGPTMDNMVEDGDFIGLQINDANEKISIKNVI